MRGALKMDNIFSSGCMILVGQFNWAEKAQLQQVLSSANSDLPASFLDLSDIITAFSNKGFTAQ